MVVFLKFRTVYQRVGGLISQQIPFKFEEHGVFADSAAKLPDLDGYAAAMATFRFMANALWDTDTTVAKLEGR